MPTDIKQVVTQCIEDFVAAENQKCETALWQTPLVGFADAGSEYIQSLKEIVHPDHQLPQEVLPDATIVIAYYVPFAEWLTKTNCRGAEHTQGISGDTSADSDLIAVNPTGNNPADDNPNDSNPIGDNLTDKNLASSEWAQGYELTNAMFERLNEHIIDTVHKLGYQAKTSPEGSIFYRDQVISHWSFRHFAYAAGLGTFGVNHMLITEKGCSGRVNTVVTNLDAIPDEPQREEACLLLREGRCGACIRNCPTQALTADGFDRHKCFQQCLKNADVYCSFGSSYGAEGGSEVCGKCVAGLPCTYKRP